VWYREIELPNLAGSVSRRDVIAAVAGLGAGALRAATIKPRIAAFRSDVTPEPGEPLIWTVPTAKVESPLWAKGVIIEAAGVRYVLCAVDWCGLLNSTHLLFRKTIAEAAGTGIEHVMVQTVHQHTAPYIDGGAYTLLRQLPSPPRCMSDAFLGRAMDRLARAVREAAAQARPFDQIGTGEARVDRVASARRVRMPDGKMGTRYSGSGKDPVMAALPEGPIDPMMKTVAFAAAGKTLVRLFYYATHPQTYCCDGTVSGDIVNTAREAVEQSEGVPQLYFTGCAGDVTVGKYNDGPAAAHGLAQRLERGMRDATAATRFRPVGKIVARTATITLPPPVAMPVKDAAALARMAAAQPSAGDELYRAAIRLAFTMRKGPFTATALALGDIRILHLPGEPMLEFQKYAQSLRPKGFVAVAGYGDLSSGYLCTDRAWTEGGYEPSASNSGPGTETAVKKAIQELLKD
jgi:hypothetical protein